MEKHLKVLIVEDSEDDAVLLIRQLNRDGYSPISRRVDRLEDMKVALNEREWDVIISDYVLPRFSGLEALKLVQDLGLDIPCIIVSGRITDETAVSAMKAGARDYIMKDNLKRIGAAIEREMAETETRKEKIKTQAQLDEVSEKLHLVTEAIQDFFWMSVPGSGEIVYLSPAYEEIWGRKRSDILKLPSGLMDTIYPEDRQVFADSVNKHTTGRPYVVEYRIIRPDGSIRWIYDRGYPIFGNRGEVTMMTGVARDITPQKMAEDNLKKVNRARDVLIKVNEALIRSQSENELLQTVCNIIVEAGGYRMSWVGYPGEGDPKILVPVAHAGHEEGYLNHIKIIWADERKEQGPTNRAIQTALPCVARDILKDSSRLPWRDDALKRGYASFISLPLINRKQVFGVLNIYTSEPNRFDADEYQLLSWLANDLSFGIIALQTRIECDHAEDRIRAMANRLVQLQEDERRNIARELHDQIGQSLTGLKLMINQVVRTQQEHDNPVLNEAQSVVTELIQQVREMSLLLRPSMLDDLGLLPTLLWHFQRYITQTGIKVNFEQYGLQRNFSPDISTASYRIVQEALTNVARYAKVKEVKVRIFSDQDIIRLQIEDHGIGFDLNNLSSKESTGISGMRERAQLLGGSVSIETGPGTGTCVTAEIPLRKIGIEEEKKDNT